MTSDRGAAPEIADAGEVDPRLSVDAIPYERARPIFDRSRRRFHPIASAEVVRVDEAAVHLRLPTLGGPVLQARITFPDPSVARLQRAAGREPGAHHTEMLAGEVPALPLRVSETAEGVVVDAGGPPLMLGRDPWRVRFGSYASEPSDTASIQWVAEASGCATGSDGVQSLETFALAADEQLYGLGERYLGPGLRGRRLAHWIDNPFGTNTTDRVHKSVPFLVSSRGYGLFVHQSEEAVFDLGATSSASASVLVHADELDLFVILGEPKDVLTRYTALTGRAPAPPNWSFGLWTSRCMFETAAEVFEVLDTYERHGIDMDVVNLDPRWLANFTRLRGATTGVWNDFDWNTADFGPMEDFIAEVHRRGVRLCLWLNPLVAEGSPEWRDERLVSGGAVREPFGTDRGFVDFTGAGRDWWLAEIARLVEAGVDAFKLDHGETLPAAATMADGRTGAEVHNLYPLLMSATAADAGAPLAFTRGGTAGSQRHPVHWAGDTQSTWAGLAGALRGGLAAAWSGFAHWSTDIGGHYARDLWRSGEADHGVHLPDPELYVRWVQFGLLLSHARFHGVLPREPWHFGEPAVEITRRFARLRASLRPYLTECAAEAEATGWPLLRPVAFEFPEDRGARDVDTEFLLGPALLVCPVLAPGGRTDVYVPPGTWTDHFTGRRLEGPGWVHEDVPLERIPLLVREGYEDRWTA